MYSESDTRSKFIDPKIKESWRQETQIVREWSFTDGRKLPGNKRGKQCYLDYLLKDFGLNLAIIEAKKYWLSPTEWLEQVKEYGRKLDIRRVYSTNGQEIYEFDLINWLGCMIDRYPTPAELYDRYTDEYATIRQQILSMPYCIEWGKKPRYYQDLAITRALTAVAQGKHRILLTLATGTGKTVIAFQICYKLLQAKWSRNGFNRRSRILFLADRNILISQAMNTFNPIERDILQITGTEIKKRLGIVPTNANIFFSIYQAMISWSDEDIEIESNQTSNNINTGGYYKQYDPDFFDMIIIDECHRWWANTDGNRFAILDYFKSAVQIWMTATPKRQDNIDTYWYFGDPVYQYSLREWINDWFLTPYKVKRIQTNMDELVIDDSIQIIHGEAKKDLYEIKDFDKNIIVPERTDFVSKVMLDHIWTMEKTIIFCVDQEHAARVRDAINSHKTISDPDYCVRVTSNDWENGRQFLEKFQDNDKAIPVILTSSQMLTTWVDAKNVRNIVLMRNIWSMTEFKQIIGRGTRVFDGKDYFTIIDFTGASNLFYDPAWDWESVGEVSDEDKSDNISDIDKNNSRPKDNIYIEDGFSDFGSSDDIYTEPTTKLRVKLSNDRELRIINIETRYIDDSGKPMSATEYLESLIGKLPALYTSEEQLRTLRSDPKTREDLLHELENIWLDDDQFVTLQIMFGAKDSDIFDILAHLSFDEDIKTKSERAQWAWSHSAIFQQSNYHIQAKEFLDYLLRYYTEYGSTEMVQSKIWDLIKLYGRGDLTVIDMTKVFGWADELMKAWKDMQEELFVI